MNYELCKKLKEAGFPKMDSVVAGQDFYSEPWSSAQGFYEDTDQVLTLGDNGVRIPTLSELIEACVKEINSDDFVYGERLNLTYDERGYTAIFVKIYPLPKNSTLLDRLVHGGGIAYKGKGATPEEAVANLWLKLNEK